MLLSKKRFLIRSKSLRWLFFLNQVRNRLFDSSENKFKMVYSILACFSNLQLKSRRQALSSLLPLWVRKWKTLFSPTSFPGSTPLSRWRLREGPGTHRYDTHADWSEDIDILTLVVIGWNCLPCKMTILCSCICFFLCNWNEIIVY